MDCKYFRFQALHDGNFFAAFGPSCSPQRKKRKNQSTPKWFIVAPMRRDDEIFGRMVYDHV
jgi:hypothetical protein